MFDHVTTRLVRALTAASAAGILCACDGSTAQAAAGHGFLAQAGAAEAPASRIALIGEPIPKYLDVPASARGPALPAGKPYRLQALGSGLYMVTDNAYQSMFLVHDGGVVVVDAPPSYAAHIPRAIAEVTDRPVTHVVYSHSHIDHIGGTRALGGQPVIVAHDETARRLRRAADPNRPLPTVTFTDRHTLRVGGQVLELSYPGNGHEPGNIYIHAPAQRVLMVVDVVFRDGCRGAASRWPRTSRDTWRRWRRSGGWTGRRWWAATWHARGRTPTWSCRPPSTAT